MNTTDVPTPSAGTPDTPSAVTSGHDPSHGGGDDPRPLLARALDQVGALIHGTAEADAHRPTPCDGFDVNLLIGHLHGAVRRVGTVVAGEPYDSVPVDLPPGDWRDDWDAARAETDAALAAADLDRIVQVPWGEVPIRSSLGMYVGEFTTHAWDLAAATGRADQLDDELAEIVLPMTMQGIPADMRGGPVPFGPVVPVPEDASAYERLVAWTGRDPAR